MVVPNAVETQTMVFGDVTVTRIIEYVGTVELTKGQFFPEATEAMWAPHGHWLDPDHAMPATPGDTTLERVCRTAIQTWLIRSAGRVILVDTGVGNGKERPYAPIWSHRQTDFLSNLAAAGVAPDEVDVVVNTHLHIDHVGWNTRLENRSWVPTFPNASYLMPAPDVEFWNPANGHEPLLGRGNQNVFEDSVAPVLAAGLVQQWSDRHVIDENLLLEAAPGHTPGSAVLKLSSGSDRALFVGDLIHGPIQIVEPDVNSCFCEDPVMARRSRRRLFQEAADTGMPVFPAHLAGQGAFTVRQEAGGFAVASWAPFGRK